VGKTIQRCGGFIRKEKTQGEGRESSVHTRPFPNKLSGKVGLMKNFWEKKSWGVCWERGKKRKKDGVPQ